MLEKDLLETHNFPPINSFKKPFKKPSIEINQTAIKHYKDLTPLRTRESHNTKIMTITSMPFIGIEDHTFKVLYITKIYMNLWFLWKVHFRSRK